MLNGHQDYVIVHSISNVEEKSGKWKRLIYLQWRHSYVGSTIKLSLSNNTIIMKNPKIKAVFFDFMGTCLDWHSGAMKALPQSIIGSERSKLALEWRHSYMDANAARLAAGEPPEDIDITLRTTLDVLLEKHSEYSHLFDDHVKDRCIVAWHSMPAWAEVPSAIEQLKLAGYEVFVFANGTTRLQLDLCKSSGLRFNMLFSSELLGIYKPAPQSYRKALHLVKAGVGESVMVAAHAYDVRGGKAAGMRTVYVPFELLFPSVCCLLRFRICHGVFEDS